MNFPYELVYAYYAKLLIDNGLPKNSILPPFVGAVMFSASGMSTTPMPAALALRAAGGQDDRQFIRDEIRHVLTRMSEKNVSGCMIVITEVWRKQNGEAEARTSLAKESDADEAVMIAMHTATESRVGFLNVTDQRTLKYGPIEAAAPVAADDEAQSPADDSRIAPPGAIWH